LRPIGAIVAFATIERPPACQSEIETKKKKQTSTWLEMPAPIHGEHRLDSSRDAPFAERPSLLLSGNAPAGFGKETPARYPHAVDPGGLQLRLIETPPSTMNVVPVTKLDASEARCSTDRAISSGLARRFSA
jgi:hypothetical protein